MILSKQPVQSHEQNITPRVSAHISIDMIYDHDHFIDAILNEAR